MKDPLFHLTLPFDAKCCNYRTS